jgi:quinol monooxygenase YgiN
MMIIVAGSLYVPPGSRDEFLARSSEAVVQARVTAGCHDFAVSPDIVEPDRVNIFEAWADRAALEAFRGSGPDDGLSSLILRAAIAEHIVQAESP